MARSAATPQQPAPGAPTAEGVAALNEFFSARLLLKRYRRGPGCPAVGPVPEHVQSCEAAFRDLTAAAAGDTAQGTPLDAMRWLEICEAFSAEWLEVSHWLSPRKLRELFTSTIGATWARVDEVPQEREQPPIDLKWYKRVDESTAVQPCLCPVCNVVCNSAAQYRAHAQGRTHRTRARREQRRTGRAPEPVVIDAATAAGRRQATESPAPPPSAPGSPTAVAQAAEPAAPRSPPPEAACPCPARAGCECEGGSDAGLSDSSAGAVSRRSHAQRAPSPASVTLQSEAGEGPLPPALSTALQSLCAAADSVAAACGEICAAERRAEWAAAVLAPHPVGAPEGLEAVVAAAVRGQHPERLVSIIARLCDSSAAAAERLSALCDAAARGEGLCAVGAAVAAARRTGDCYIPHGFDCGEGAEEEALAGAAARRCAFLRLAAGLVAADVCAEELLVACCAAVASEYRASACGYTDALLAALCSSIGSVRDQLSADGRDCVRLLLLEVRQASYLPQRLQRALAPLIAADS